MAVTLFFYSAFITEKDFQQFKRLFPLFGRERIDPLTQHTGFYLITVNQYAAQKRIGTGTQHICNTDEGIQRYCLLATLNIPDEFGT